MSQSPESIPTKRRGLPGHINMGFSLRFATQRLLFIYIISLGPLAICLASGQGLLGLLLLAVALWPHRFTFSAEARGLRVSWLFLREWLLWSDIDHAELLPDPRKFVIGARKPVLRLSRRDGRLVTISAHATILERLAHDITHHSAMAQLSPSPSPSPAPRHA